MLLIIVCCVKKHSVYIFVCVCVYGVCVVLMYVKCVNEHNS